MLVLFVRDMTGGIRKHVLSIVQEFEFQPGKLLLVTNSASGDLSYQDYLNKNSWLRSSLMDLPIKRSPHPSDFINFVRLYFKILKIPGKKVFHGHGAKGGLFARVLGRFLNAKTIYTPHGGSAHAMFGWFGNFIYGLFEKLLSKLTDQFIFESNYSYKRFVEIVGDISKRSVVNFNGVEFPKLEPLENKFDIRPFRIGAFGELRNLKGYDLLVWALSKLLVRGLDCELVIFGEGSERKKLEDLVVELNVSGKVHLLGITKTPLLEMKRCHVVAQPSRFESFGFSALEAISVGTPVIATKVGGLIEVIEPKVSGVLVDPEDPVALANGIESLLQNYDEWNRVRQSAYLWASTKFDQKKSIENLFSIYKDLGFDWPST